MFYYLCILYSLWLNSIKSNIDIINIRMELLKQQEEALMTNSQEDYFLSTINDFKEQLKVTKKVRKIYKYFNSRKI